MRTADHLNLSRYMMEHMAGKSPAIYRAAFIFGSIEPDINMLTYFRGSIHGEEKLRGHNYENARKYMEKLTEKLERGSLGRLRQSFLLGKLVHYVADAFTYPHNSMFPGNLRQHCQYETELHGYVNDMLGRDEMNMESLPENVDIISVIESMHESYECMERAENSVYSEAEMKADYRYITFAISSVTDRFWQTEPGREKLLDEIKQNVPALPGAAMACSGQLTVPAGTHMTVSGNASKNVHTNAA